MSKHAVQVLEADFDYQSKFIENLGGLLLKRQYLKNVGVSHQTLWNWRTGRCSISRRKALDIERRTGERVQCARLLARGDDERIAEQVDGVG